MKLPAVFGKYHLLEKIATGGMAEVFLAKSFGVAGFERLLVIKKILPHLSESKEFITMFIDEARIAATLSHSNIVQITELGQEKDDYYIAMEFVHGKDLGKVYGLMESTGQKMPLGLAAFVVIRVCEALDYAHRKKDAEGESMKIVHRDVSPSNVLISYDGDVKLIDFGVARAQNRLHQTDSGAFKGKVGYLSPELVRGQPVDHRSDIFASGVLLYELATGKRLFGSDGEIGTMEKIRRCDIVPPSRHNSQLPPQLEKIILKALAADPAERYQWASDLAEELSPFLVENGNLISTKHLARFMQEKFADVILEEEKRLALYNRRGYPWVDKALEEKEKLAAQDIEPRHPSPAKLEEIKPARIQPPPPPLASRPRLKSFQPAGQEEKPAQPKSTGTEPASSQPLTPEPGWRRTLLAFMPFLGGFLVALAAAALAFLVLYSRRPAQMQGDDSMSAKIKFEPLPQPTPSTAETTPPASAQRPSEEQTTDGELLLDLSQNTNQPSDTVPSPQPPPSPVPDTANSDGVKKDPARPDSNKASGDHTAQPTKTTVASLTIESEPEGALVLLNGKESGATPITIEELDEKAAYFLVLKAPGYKPFVKGIKFDGQKQLNIQAKLLALNETAELGEKEPAAAPAAAPAEQKQEEKAHQAAAAANTEQTPPASASGYLTVNCTPWAKVIIDDRDTGLWTPVPPTNKIELPAGRHRLKLRTQDGRELEKEIEIQSGQLLKIIEKFE